MGDLALGFLHLYGQAMWHDDAHIVGDRDGIRMLRDALTAALAHEDGVAMAYNVFTNDGEGYEVSVYVVGEADMRRMACPYVDDVAKAPPKSFWPWHLSRKPHRPTPTSMEGERNG